MYSLRFTLRAWQQIVQGFLADPGRLALCRAGLNRYEEDTEFLVAGCDWSEASQTILPVRTPLVVIQAASRMQTALPPAIQEAGHLQSFSEQFQALKTSVPTPRSCRTGCAH